MCKNSRFTIIALSLCSLIFSVSVVVCPAQNVISTILGRMDSYNKSLRTYRSDLTLIQFSSQLKVTDTSTGSIFYFPKMVSRPKTYLRINWIKPVAEQISVIDDDFVLYRPRLNQAITGSLQKARRDPSVNGVLNFLHLTKAQLEKDYDVTYLGEEKLNGSTPTWHLRLSSKSGRGGYKSSDVWIDQDGMPLQVRVTEINDDMTTIRFSNIERNFLIEDLIIKIDLPKSVKRIKA